MNIKKYVTLTSVVVLILLFFLGLAVLTKVTSEPPSEEDGLFSTVLKEMQPKDEIVNILVMGLDQTSSLTDTIVLANYNLTSGKVSLLSIPRDTRVLLYEEENKINAAYSLGGYDFAVETVSKLIGTDIQYFAIFNLEGFRQVVDLLGGVELDIPFDMYYVDNAQNLHIDLKKGRQVLNGEQAEQYMRYRAGYAEGDVGRIKAQKLFFEALIKQKLNPLYISKADDIMSAVREHLVTNIKPADFVKLAKGLVRINADEVEYYLLPGEILDRSPYYYLFDLEKTTELINSKFLTDLNKKAQPAFILPDIADIPEETPPPPEEEDNDKEPFVPPVLNVDTPELFKPIPTQSPTPVPESPQNTLSPAG